MRWQTFALVFSKYIQDAVRHISQQ